MMVVSPALKDCLSPLSMMPLNSAAVTLCELPFALLAPRLPPVGIGTPVDMLAVMPILAPELLLLLSLVFCTVSM